MSENELHGILHGSKTIDLETSNNQPETSYAHTGPPPGYTAPQHPYYPPQSQIPQQSYVGPQPQPQAPQQSYFNSQPVAGQGYTPGYQPLVNQPQPSSNSTTTNTTVVVQQPGIVLRPYNYLVHSILTTFFCCPLLGIIALIYGCLVDSAHDDGDFSRARSFSAIARTLNIAALILGIFLVVGGFVYSMTAANN